MEDKDLNIKYELFNLGGNILSVCIIWVPDEKSKTKQKQKSILKDTILKNYKTSQKNKCCMIQFMCDVSKEVKFIETEIWMVKSVCQVLGEKGGAWTGLMGLMGTVSVWENGNKSGGSGGNGHTMMWLYLLLLNSA